MRNKREVPQSIRKKVTRVGARIAELRLAKGLTQEKLAYGVGIAKSYLGYIEKGKSNPTIETLYLIADGLDCDIDTFFD
ncbi:MAG: helix-turn-helix transcriptional regulator [Candidatus Margulisiibacteriota bacterium]